MNVSKLIDRCAFITCAFLLIGLSTVSYAQVDFDEVYIFGDSLSDAGNIYQLTGETSKAPYAVVPTRPYAIGGHHFSNGKTWAERLAQNLNDNSGGKASLQNPGKNGNYAFGGARARSGSGHSSPDSGTQTLMYLGDYGSASANALYVFQFGGNDLRDALVAAQSDVNAAFVIIQTAAQELVGNIQALYAAGAKNFLVANAPNLAHAPAVKLSGASGAAGLFTGFYNGGLEVGLQQLELGIPDINIYRLDVAGFMDDVVANPGDFGLADTDFPCLTFFTESDAKCDNPEDRLFWDGLHPTAAGHNALSAVATAVVNGN
jgi:phospholipase/lecithinase/hemolysin